MRVDWEKVSDYDLEVLDEKCFQQLMQLSRKYGWVAGERRHSRLMFPVEISGIGIVDCGSLSEIYEVSPEEIENERQRRFQLKRKKIELYARQLVIVP